MSEARPVKAAAGFLLQTIKPIKMSGQHGGRRAGAGRKPDAVSKAKRELAEMARDHAEAALRTLAEIAARGESESARVSAAIAILDRGYGKPPQFSTGDPDRFARAVDLTDDELADIAGRGGDRTSAPETGPPITH